MKFSKAKRIFLKYRKLGKSVIIFELHLIEKFPQGTKAIEEKKKILLRILNRWETETDTWKSRNWANRCYRNREQKKKNNNS